MKLTNYGTWHRFSFWGNGTELNHVIWTRNKNLWKDTDLINRMKSAGYTKLHYEPCVSGEWGWLQSAWSL
jgi:hypothetical protein